MEKIEFRLKKRLILSRLILLSLAILLILYPQIFQRYFLTKKVIILIGSVAVFWMLMDILGFIILFYKTNIGLVITKDQIIDNSKYQSFENIPWDEVKYIKIKKSYYGKKYLEIGLSDKFSHTIKINLLQKILLWFSNYGDKSKVILSNSTLSCSEKELEESVFLMYNKSSINQSFRSLQ